MQHFWKTLLEIICIRTFSEIISFDHSYLTQYVSDDINSLKRKLLEVHPYLIITMEPVLYTAAGTRQLELIMYILSFSYSSGAI